MTTYDELIKILDSASASEDLNYKIKASKYLRIEADCLPSLTEIQKVWLHFYVDSLDSSISKIQMKIIHAQLAESVGVAVKEIYNVGI